MRDHGPDWNRALFEFDPQQMTVRRFNTTEEVWLVDARGQKLRFLGTAKWVRGIVNIKFVCHLHRDCTVDGEPAKCGIFLRCEGNFAAVDSELQTFFGMAAAYRDDVPLDQSVRHHLDVAQRAKARVQFMRPMSGAVISRSPRSRSLSPP